MSENGTENNTFTTTEGMTLTVHPVSQIRLQRVENSVIESYKVRGEPIEPPQYEVEDVAGTIETFSYNSQTIKSAPEEDKKKWSEHLLAVARMEAEILEQTTKLMLLKGFQGIEVPSEWIEEQKYFGVKIPEDERDLRLMYLTDEILVTPDDQKRATWAVMQASSAGMDADILEAAKDAFFRNVHEESKRRAGKAVKELANQEGALETQLAVEHDPQYQKLGETTV